MIPYKLDFAINRLIKTGPSMERTLLRIYTGDDISDTEAKNIWERIADHKWYVSERLSRDVGFHVAAVDYVENFYQPLVEERPEGKFALFFQKMQKRAGSAVRRYFELKGQAINF